MTRGNRFRRIVGFVACGLLVALLASACDSGSGGETGNGDAAATLDQALADHVAGRIDEARQGYEDVLDLEPDNPFALYNLGLIAQNEGDAVAGEDFYRRALAVDPEFEAALYNLAILRAQQGDTDEAIELYERTIEVNPASAGAHLNLGFLYLELGKEKKGNAEIKKAIDLDPSLADRVAPPKGVTNKKASPSPSE